MKLAIVISALRISEKIQFRPFLSKFSCCRTREDLSIDVSITTVGLILTKLEAQNYELAVDRYMHPRMTGMHKILLRTKV